MLRVVKLTDPVGDSSGEFDLVAAEYAMIADQCSIKLTFNQPFDPSNPSLHYSALSGDITLDSDCNLLTGAFFMGAQIPTWGGDGDQFETLYRAHRYRTARADEHRRLRRHPVGCWRTWDR